MKVCEVEFVALSCGCSRVTDEKDQSMSAQFVFGRILNVKLSEFETGILSLSTVGFV
jgi:hypothetical protein